MKGLDRNPRSGWINEAITDQFDMKKIAEKLVDWFIPFGIILLLSVGTYQRNSIWNSELELWKDCVKKSPQKERVHHNLGFVYYELGRWDDAEEEFEEALRLNPRYALSLYNLGLLFYRKGYTDEAIDYYQKAIELDPNFPDSYYNLGIAYHQKGPLCGCRSDLQEIVRG